MTTEDKSKVRKIEMPHTVVIDGRERLSVSGVEEVESFDENIVIMLTTRGILEVRGENLHIGRLNLDNGELALEGLVFSVAYEDDEAEKGGFFSRLFR